MAREIVINDELIPWASLRGRALEELLWELLSEMGAKDLDYRSGGSGGGAADGGRDLEAVFYQPTPDGEVESQKWWLEAKGRTGTVEPEAVKLAVINANERKGVDLLIVATNSQFSNPTKDWLEDWASEHPRPKIRLWERKDLLRLIRMHPVVAARVIPDILPDEERMRSLSDQFHEIGKPPSEKDLEYFWNIRDSIDQVDEIASLTYGELLYGDLTLRPWGTLISNANSQQALVEAVLNLPSVLMRTGTVSNEKLSAAGSYLLQSALRFIEPSIMASFLRNPFDYIEDPPEAGKRDPGPYVEAFVRPVWERCKNELLDACSQDCARISCDQPSTLNPSEADRHFWRRFNMDIKDPHQDGVLHIYDLERPCAVGLDLGNRTCPLEEEPSFSEQEIMELAAIVNYRRVRPDGRYLEIIKAYPSRFDR